MSRQYVQSGTIHSLAGITDVSDRTAFVAHAPLHKLRSRSPEEDLEPHPVLPTLRGNQPITCATYFLSLNVIGADAVSPPVMLPALNSHLSKFDFVVPHLDGPTVPVTTLNFVAGIFPL